MNYRLIAAIIGYIVILSLPVTGHAKPVVWVEDGLQRIDFSAPAGSQKSIRLYAARGEYEPFQILVRADGNNLSGVNVSIPDLTGDQGTIPAEHLTGYRAHYVKLNTNSSDWEGNNRPEKKQWFAEPLIPFNDPETGNDLQGSYDAVPFSLQQGRNQTLWIDVYVPRSTKPGNYTGTFTVTSNQGSESVDLTLTVWDFELPVRPSLPFISQIWEGKSNNKQTHIELLKHRVNPYDTFNGDIEELLEYGLLARRIDNWSEASVSSCSVKNKADTANGIPAALRPYKDRLIIFSHYAEKSTNAGISCPNCLTGQKRCENVTLPPSCRRHQSQNSWMTDQDTPWQIFGQYYHSSTRRISPTFEPYNKKAKKSGRLMHWYRMSIHPNGHWILPQSISVSSPALSTRPPVSPVLNTGRSTTGVMIHGTTRLDTARNSRQTAYSSIPATRLARQPPHRECG